VTSDWTHAPTGTYTQPGNPTMPTITATVSQILSSIGLQLDWCRDADTADGIVALAAISRDQADRAVSGLRSVG